jgi:hypothetical protein
VGEAACLEDCEDGKDNDLDELVDCEDDDCTDTKACQPDFIGELHMTRTVAGTTDCDLTVNLEGTDYTGSCPSCDFAFLMDNSVASDKSTASDCQDELWYYNLLPTKTDPYVFLWYEPQYYYYSGTYGSYQSSVLFAGANIKPTFTGDAFATHTYYSSYYYSYGGYTYSYTEQQGTFSYKGGELAWSFDVPVDYTDNYYGSYCGFQEGDAGVNLGGSYTSSEDLDCGSIYRIDVWEVETDGSALDITIDTTSLATAFDPYVWVQDASGCVVGNSDDSFTCTYPPPSYECPSVSLDETDGGMYEVIVLMYGSCAGSVGEYEIVVEHDSDPKLTLVHDNVSRYDVLTVEASGAVVK